VFSIAPAEKSGTATISSLVNGYLIEKSLLKNVEERHQALRVLQRLRRQRHLVGRGADPDRNAVRRPFGALEIADDQRDQIGRHLRRPREDDGVLPPRSRRIGRDRAVRDRVVPRVDHGGEIEGRLHRRLVEGREHPPRVGGFELRHRVAAIVRLAQIEAAQLVIESAGVFDVQSRRSGGDSFRDDQRRELRLLVDFGPRRLCRAASLDGDLLEGDLRRVEDDAIGRLGDTDVDRFFAGERRARQVGRDRQGVVIRLDVVGKAPCRRRRGGGRSIRRLRFGRRPRARRDGDRRAARGDAEKKPCAHDTSPGPSST
jgi:hypothetical protein